jgi:hypothetical protein
LSFHLPLPVFVCASQKFLSRGNFLQRDYFQLHEVKNVLDTMALGAGQYPD